MVKIKKVLQTRTFRKKVKKLHKNQKSALDDTIRVLMEKPLSGELKKGDLSYLRVYKFKMLTQQMLLGYSYEEGEIILELLNLGTHENFYRDTKNIFNE